MVQRNIKHFLNVNYTWLDFLLADAREPSRSRQFVFISENFSF